MSKAAKLYYVYDPMCSWCWGYAPTWNLIKTLLDDQLDIQYVLGGLAPDSNVPMPLEMQTQIASYWRKIESYLGTEFNHDFWTLNTPKRSTYPACRAVLAARKQQSEQDIYRAIQQAYYLEAKNPSESEVLFDLAKQVGLDIEAFRHDFLSAEINQQLSEEIKFARSIGGNSFPSLFLAHDDIIVELPIDYKNPNTTIDLVKQQL
ncbi:DsbA family protein [Vibrio mediterranei]|uniref:DsbA family protein n=1 Tax=Vibrio mediterranei TaxID=689 RepID=A0ABX5DHW1_9VIBR|nr:DsbA family protein [Vibrio mediterranei]PCD89855.1 DsbA family protein [Vibrio mediterranei]PRQ69244.1 DsbA family protein [Vibrio mediterranei]